MSCIFLLFFLASLEFNLAPFAQNLQTRSFYTLMMVWFFFFVHICSQCARCKIKCNAGMRQRADQNYIASLEQKGNVFVGTLPKCHNIALQ